MILCQCTTLIIFHHIAFRCTTSIIILNSWLPPSNEGAINYKRAIVVDCDCFHLLLSYMLSHHPSCSLTLCPSLLRSILLYLAPPHLISYSKQKENTERSPIDFFPVHVFQTAFSLINWGKWLRTSGPGPVPYCPFRFPFPILPFSPLLPFSILPTPPPVLSRPCFTL